MWSNESASDPLVCIRVVFTQDYFFKYIRIKGEVSAYLTKWNRRIH